MFYFISILTLLLLLKPFDCYFYHNENKNDFYNNPNQGILNNDNFKIDSHDIKTFLPTSFTIIANISGVLFNINFEGNIDSGSISDLYLGNLDGVQLLKSTDVYSSYSGNNAVATLVSNDDLRSLGINITSPYRIYATIHYDNYQIELALAIFKDSSYEQIYKRFNSTSNQKHDSFEEAISEFPNNNWMKKKRSINGQPQNLYIEYLVVLDNTVFLKFQKLYYQLPIELIYQYIKIFYNQLVNGIDLRFRYSLNNDPDLRIRIVLVGILLYTDPSSSPWTNRTVPGIPFNNGIGTLLANTALSTFNNFMNTLQLPFQYDYAVAITNLDIWSNNVYWPDYIRSAIIGYTYANSICTINRYSISEELGFNNFENLANLLGTVIGAVKDGGGIAVKCPASDNYIMVPTVGQYSNYSNLLLYSNCSINSFKMKLLSADKSYVLPAGQCMLNIPSSSYPTASNFPGTLWSINDQCQLVFGINSSYTPCEVPNDPICQILYCNVIRDNSTSCIGTPGFGALDGTPCGVNQVCYKTNCVDSSSLINSYSTPLSKPCSSNPCLNGLCVEVAEFYLCDCMTGFTGLNCEKNMDLTTVPITLTTTTTTKSPPKLKLSISH